MEFNKSVKYKICYSNGTSPFCSSVIPIESVSRHPSCGWATNDASCLCIETIMNHIGRAGYAAFTKLYTTELVDVSVFSQTLFYLKWGICLKATKTIKKGTH